MIAAALLWGASIFANLFYAGLLLGGIVLFLLALFLKPILGATGAGLALAPFIPALRAAGKGIGVCAALWGGWHLFVAQHDASLRDAWVAEQQLAVAAAVEQQRIRGDAAAAEAIAAARAAALADAPIREVIRRVPVQTACASSPAVRAALDGLRKAAPARPGQAPPTS